MGWRHVITGLALLLLGVGGMALTFARNDRLMRTGRRVAATVIAKSPAGHSTVPPHGSWGPSLTVRYELDGRSRRAMLWLERTTDTDYENGQVVELIVGRGLLRRVRTASDTNLPGSLTIAAEITAGVLGLGLVVWGAVQLITW